MAIEILSQLQDETKELFGGRGIVSTKAGLIKTSNEDAIGYSTGKDESFRVSIADRHWGSEAASLCVSYWLSESIDNDPIFSMATLEGVLAKRFAVPLPSAEATRTPEASVITITIYPNKDMNVVGYGDCRLSVVRDGRVVYRYRTIATWLGLFSSMELRGRISARGATAVESVPLRAGDIILLYTDGVDECIYETPTINVESFAALGATPVQVHDAIMSAVFDKGAEDNATIAVLKI